MTLNLPRKLAQGPRRSKERSTRQPTRHPRLIKGGALGRRNWLHIGDEQAGPPIAAILSVMETCRRLQIDVRAYLLDVLPKLPEWPITKVAQLTPTAWKTRLTP